MHQVRAEENTSTQSNSRSRNNFSGSNNNTENMEIRKGKMKYDFIRYQRDNHSYSSRNHEDGHSSRNHNSITIAQI